MNLSVQNKLTYTTIFLTFIVLVVIGYVGYSNTQQAYHEKILESEQTEVGDMVISIKEKLQVMKKDANFIANFYAMQKFLNWQSIGVANKVSRWEKATKDTFKSIIDLKKIYYKLRILNNDGKEQITVFYNQDTQEAYVQSNDKLQDRSKERYFTETKNLNLDEVYVSQMELNVEFGKIIYPLVPIVHFTAAIYDKNGDKRGVAIINAYADHIIESLSIHQQHVKSRILINNDGYYLHHKNKDKLWGWQLNNNDNFKQDNPETFDIVMKNEKGFYENNGLLFTYERIYPDINNRSEFWVLISHVEKDVVFAPVTRFQRTFILILIISIVSLMIILQRYINSFLHPLNQVTKQLQALSRGRVQEIEINYKANDEIGDLIDSSKRLLTNINTTINQAKVVAAGDYSKRIAIDDKDDALGNAINEMTDRLDQTGRLALELSQGEFDGNIDIKSNKDALGTALNELMDYFRRITRVAESIAMGNFDITFKSTNDKDRLGQAINEMIMTLKQVVEQANAIAAGDFKQRIIPISKDDELARALISMTNRLKDNQLQNNNNQWLQEGITVLNQELSGNKNVQEVFDISLINLARFTGAVSGAIFDYNDETQSLSLTASYAFTEREQFKNHYHKGEGIVGQVAREGVKIHLHRSSDDSMIIDSTITRERAVSTIALPIAYENEFLGVLLLAYSTELNPVTTSLLDQAVSVLGSYLFTASKNEQIKQLLEESQQSFEELQVKSEELQQSNVQMEEQRQQLEQQAAELKAQNERVEKARQELDIQTQELERSSRYKSEFLANMSHELRTPLNSIILLSKLLKENKDNKLTEQELKKADVIHRSGNDLLLLINDILDLSKVESGHMEINLSPVNTAEIRQSLLTLFDELAREKKLDYQVIDRLQGTLITDEQKVLQIMKNLLSNAFKFTKDGDVTVNIATSNKPEYAYMFEVQDSGIGIESTKQDLIFTAFKQVDGSISREFGGTGLGLSISKNFAKVLGGTITLYSQLNKGSLFTLYLPEQQDQIPSKIAHTESAPELNSNFHFKTEPNKPEIIIDVEEQSVTDIDANQLSDKNIIIVDDDPRNIFTISSVLQVAGALTMHALNGKEAIEKIHHHFDELDLVLMDIMMPEMDGYETIQKIRTDKDIANIPIIAVTAKAMKEERQKCLDAGADDYISKPIDMNLLLKLCVSWIEKGR
ncbi:MAG: response regulator [Gammaproteobacteria bacterium]|nr:response regulator [Gammaproteobacteria bacterium]